MGETINYQFPTYEDGDSPDLTNQYNSAVASIDQHIKQNETAASNAERGASKAQSDVDALKERVNALEGKSGDFVPSPTDKPLTAAQLAKAKVTANGIIYFKEGV